MLFMNRYYDVIVINNQFYIVTLWQWVEMWNLKIFALDYWKEYEPWQMTNMTSALVILKILLRQVFPTFHKCFDFVSVKINKKVCMGMCRENVTNGEFQIEMCYQRAMAGRRPSGY